MMLRFGWPSVLLLSLGLVRARICPGDCSIWYLIAFANPLLAGVRGATVTARRLLFRAGEVMIDLSVEPTSKQSQILLVGQVLDSSISGVGIVEVPVLLLNGREMLAETETNLYGEFQLECSEDKNLQISVGVTQDKDIFIPLDESIWKTSSEHRVH